MVCDLVTHDLHDVVAVGDETDGDDSGQDSELPDRHGGLGASCLAGLPCGVDDGPRADSVADIVGAVGEGGGAGGEDLDEGVRVLDFVAVFLCRTVHTSHADAFGSSIDAGLGRVNVVVGAVEESDGDHGGDAHEGDFHVLELVDLTSAERVLVEIAHGPSERALATAELGVEAFAALTLEFFVCRLDLGGFDLVEIDVGHGHVLLIGAELVGGADGSLGRCDFVFVFLVVLDDGIVADAGDAIGVLWDWTGEEEGTLNDVVPADMWVLEDDGAVDVGDEEDGGKDGETNAGAHGDRSNEPWWTSVELQVWRALVDDGQGANGSGDEEEEWAGEDGPFDGVLAHVDDQLDQHEDGGAEASSDSWRHAESSEDGTETLAAVPSPLNVASTGNGDTHTSNGGDQRVGGGDVGGVLSAPHDPERGTGESAGEAEHLDAGVVLEGIWWDDFVLDGVCRASSDGDGAHHFEDGGEDHGPAIGDGARGDGGGPGVGDIVGTWVMLEGKCDRIG